MKHLIIIFFCLFSFFICLAQGQRQDSAKVNPAVEKYWKEWVNNLYDAGISMNKDSIHISDEAKKVMQDSSYRTLIFPIAYTWPQAIAFLKQMELKKAFWYLIKLYIQDSSNKSLVIQTVLPFDKAFEMDKVLISTFYTYALLDPQVCIFKNSKVEITHPDILEKEFSQVKEIAAYISANRKTSTITTNDFIHK